MVGSTRKVDKKTHEGNPPHALDLDTQSIPWITSGQENNMLTTNQTDIIMSSLGLSACISFVLTMLLNQTDYWLVTSVITLIFVSITATLDYTSRRNET